MLMADLLQIDDSSVSPRVLRRSRERKLTL
jgi:hypothetical protein